MTDLQNYVGTKREEQKRDILEKQKKQAFLMFKELIEIRDDSKYAREQILQIVKEQAKQWEWLSNEEQLQLLNIMIYDTKLSYREIYETIIKPKLSEETLYTMMVYICEQIIQSKELS